MRKFQHGFSLFELILVIAVTSFIGVWSATAWFNQSEDLASEAMGRWLMSVKMSVDQMLVRQADILTGLSSPASSSTNYQDVWRPTLAELVRAGHLPSGFSLLAPLGYDVSIRVLKPSGQCLTLGCKLEVFTVAIPQASQGDHSKNVTRLGNLLAAFEGSGASVSQLSPGRVRGPNLDLPNPPAVDFPLLPVGSVVLYSFYDSSAQVSFLRQGERRDVQLGANLDVEGRLTVREGMSSGGDIRASGPISSDGGIFANGRISSAGNLQLGAVAVQGTPCDAAGLLAQSSAGGLLVCQGGVWRSSTQSSGGFFVERAGFYCDVDDVMPFNYYSFKRANPMTGDCSCPAGYEPRLVSVWSYPRDSHNDYYTYICVN